MFENLISGDKRKKRKNFTLYAEGGSTILANYEKDLNLRSRTTSLTFRYRIWFNSFFKGLLRVNSPSYPHIVIGKSKMK